MARSDYVPRHMRTADWQVGASLLGDRGTGAAGPSHDAGLGSPRSHGASRVAQALFVLLFFCMLLVPLVGMPLVHEDSDAEKRDLAPAPELVVDGVPNLAFLSDAGDYFADHFALRGLLVDVDATLKQRLFATSATPNVVVGRHGWLYYEGELADYQRTGLMGERALAHAAHNLSLMQRYVEGLGKRFVVVIAPNKSTVCPANMPYYEMAGEGASNLERLMPLLHERGVNVVGATSLLASRGEELYFERDSHWNDEGALLVYDAINAALGGTHVSFSGDETKPDGHVGDLDAMLHPVTATPEGQDRNTHVDDFEFLGEATNVEDGYVVTAGRTQGSQGTLLMYRDSFGNNLLPPFASAYGQAVFTKLVPYDMGTQMVGFAQDVVVERAERHLQFFATDPPYLPAPEIATPPEEAPRPTSTTVYVERNEPYLVVEGTLGEELAGEERVYVQLVCADGSAHTYECFRMVEKTDVSSDFEGQSSEEDVRIQGDEGYRVCIEGIDNTLGDVQRVRILVGSESAACEVASMDM